MENPVGIIERKIGFRLSAAPSVPLYAGARSAGMLHLRNGWTQPEKTPEYLEFFWCESGTFHFPLVKENRRVLLTPGMAMFLFPGDLHCQHVCSKTARYFWLTIDGHPEELIRHYHLKREPFYAGDVPVALFQRLIGEVAQISPFMQYQASCTALEIIHHALSKKEAVPATKTIEEFCRLIEFQFADSACCVEQLAEQMNISRVTLYRLVRNAFGCTPKEYLERRRLQEAMALLTGTRLAVREIAARCGCTYSNYFARTFRSKMNCSPEEFRRTGGPHPVKE